MADLLNLPPPTIGERATMAVASVAFVSFGFVFAGFPIYHILREIHVGKVPWPLVGFSALAIPLGAFLIYAGIRYMPWMISYRFTIDRGDRVFGYYKDGRWLWKRHLGNVTSIVTRPGYSRSHWPWNILIQKDGAKEELLITSFSPLSSEREAFTACAPLAQKIADYLGVGLLHEEWSPEAKTRNEK